jgi:hypothetical protein
LPLDYSGGLDESGRFYRNSDDQEPCREQGDANAGDVKNNRQNDPWEQGEGRLQNSKKKEECSHGNNPRLRYASGDKPFTVGTDETDYAVAVFCDH